jgi:hypothetical protein
MVLETGLMERKVTGTGSNAVSSRSHGFFHIEIKKRDVERQGPWSSSNLTIVDLAGSERARNAKTAGETLAEAGKINESLMYLGQCMQMQSDNQGGSKVRTNSCLVRSTTNSHPEYRAIPSVQTYGASLLKLLPGLRPSSTIASSTAKVHYGRNGRSQRRLQRNISDPPLLCSRSRGYCATYAVHLRHDSLGCTAQASWHSLLRTGYPFRSYNTLSRDGRARICPRRDRTPHIRD